MNRIAVALASIAVACAAPKHAAKPDAGAADAGLDCSNAPAGAPITVTVADALHITQSGVPDVMATIPAGCFSSIVVSMTVTTACDTVPPSGMNWPPACDPYDRLAQISLDDSGATPLFLLDAVTSFGGTATWTQDVTDYAMLLAGTHAFKIDVGTYADPAGMATGTMSSHDVSVSIALTPGPAPHDVLAVIPIFRSDVSDSTVHIDEVNVPADASGGRLDFFTSGHGGNGNPPCDEFCEKYNDVIVDSTSLFRGTPWVSCSDNCTEETVTTSLSCGGETFNYICKQNPTSCPSSAVASRSNWCPSQIINLIPLDWPQSALTGMHNVSVGVEMVDGTWSLGLAAVFWK